MIGLDTNVLIRYLTQYDPVQSAKATEILERRLTLKNPGFVSVVAMVETAWVLDRAYGLPAEEIAGSLHCHGCVKTGAGIIRERVGRRARSARRMCPHADV